MGYERLHKAGGVLELSQYVLLIVLMWTAVVGALLSIAFFLAQQEIRDLARAEARAAINKDLVYRRWAANHGGIYVPVTASTPPNPYLINIPERDITTPSGRKLTLINPAYMTRQVFELAEDSYGYHSHITSLQPVRPQNKADDWETTALKSFEKGDKEISSVELIHGDPHLRLMRPLITEEPCLRCHAVQGYKVGDVRGGISVSIPLKPWIGRVNKAMGFTFAEIGGLWLLGLGGILVASRSLRVHLVERANAEKALEGYKENLENLVTERTSELENKIVERDRAEAALKESETKYRLMAENSTDMLSKHSMEGVYLYVSPACKSLLGYEPDELTGKPAYNFFHPDDVEIIREAYATITQLPIVNTISYRILRKDGRYIWFETNIFAIFDKESGEVIEIQASSRDISERKQAEAALLDNANRFRAIFEGANDAMMLLTDKGFIDCNRHTVEMFGYERKEEITRRHPAELSTPSQPNGVDSFDAFRAHVERAFANGVERFEWLYRRKDGDAFPTEVVLSAFDYGGRTILQATVRDISERKRAEEALKQLNEELENKVAERTSQLEATNKELEAFTYSVSHDLRAPLRAIDGYSLAVMEDYSESIDEDGKYYINRIRSSVHKMADLIEDLLKLSRITRSEIYKTDVNLSALAAEVIGSLREMEPGRAVTVDIADNLICNADPRLMSVVLTNLLSNAWKYSSKKDNPKIEFGSTEKDGGIVYYIRDNGAGFNMEYSSKLFQPFQRLHTSDEFQGTGIGLATVYRIIKKHGGDIWAQSTVGEGSVFYFTL